MNPNTISIYNSKFVIKNSKSEIRMREKKNMFLHKLNSYKEKGLKVQTKLLLNLERAMSQPKLWWDDEKEKENGVATKFYLNWKNIGKTFLF